MRRANDATPLYCEAIRGYGCANEAHHQAGLHYPLDGDMLPIVRALHQKGYRTRHCCAGHAARQPFDLNVYVEFTQVYTLSLPEGFVFERSAWGGTRVRAYRGKSLAAYAMSRDEARAFLAAHLAALLSWAQALEPVGVAYGVGEGATIIVDRSALPVADAVMALGLTPYKVEPFYEYTKAYVEGDIRIDLPPMVEREAFGRVRALWGRVEDFEQILRDERWRRR